MEKKYTKIQTITQNQDDSEDILEHLKDITQKALLKFEDNMNECKPLEITIVIEEK